MINFLLDMREEQSERRERYFKYLLEDRTQFKYMDYLMATKAMMENPMDERSMQDFTPDVSRHFQEVIQLFNDQKIVRERIRNEIFDLFLKELAPLMHFPHKLLLEPEVNTKIIEHNLDEPVVKDIFYVREGRIG